MPATTTAALLRAPGEAFELTELELSPPGPGEVLIEMAATGICHTDLSVAKTGLDPRMACVLGHEGAGTVAEIGPGVEYLAPGDPVVLSFAHCGECPSCTAGHPAYCRSAAALNFAGRRLDGSTSLSTPGGEPVCSHFFGQSSFARHAVVHESSTVKVDASPAELELLGPLGCSVQTGAGTILRVLAPLEDEPVAIFGAGAVGLSAVMAAAAVDASPIFVVEPHPDRRELALEFGAAEALDPADGDAARKVRKATQGGVTAAIETVGAPAVIGAALATLRSPGRCVTLALPGGPNPVEVDQSTLLFGRSFEGVIEGDAVPQQLIPRLLAFWREGRLPFERMIRTYPFEQIGAACEDARTGRTIKPVLSFGTEERA